MARSNGKATNARKVARPGLGNNANKKWPVRVPAGGDNVHTSGGPPRVNNNSKRGYAS